MKVEGKETERSIEIKGGKIEECEIPVYIWCRKGQSPLI
jgi:hypothetical protein